MTGVQALSQRQENQSFVDNLPPDHRLIVHEFGYPIYRALLRAGVNRPGRMRDLVLEIWAGARGSARGSKPRGFQGSENLATLDWLLIQSGSNVSAATLIAHLRRSGLAIVPIEPSKQMIEASMATVSGHSKTVTKSRKHALRLRAAMEAGMHHLWPFLRRDNDPR